MANTANKPSIFFWVIGIISLIWNAIGISAYLQQAYNTDSFRAMYSSEQLVIIDNLPTWYTAIFAVAVFSSIFGAILFLLKKKAAVLLFKIAFLAVIIQTAFNLFINEGKEFYGSFEYSMLLMIPLVSFFLLIYSKKSAKKEWLL